jgi:hypothetical protein
MKMRTMKTKTRTKIEEVWFKLSFLSSLVPYMVASDKDSFLDICKGAQEGSLTQAQKSELDRLFKAFDERSS